jgi:ABC-2 type transport system permease protein
MSTRFVLVLIATSLRASVALRGAFLLQAGLMALNNLFFFTTWWILLRHFDSIRGWRLHDVMALFGVSAAGFGGAAVLCGGMFELARLISDGELDALLAQPKSVLLRALASRTRASGFGDVASGTILLALSGYWHWYTTPTVLLAVILATVGFVASGVLAHSLAFWLGRVEVLSRQLFDFVTAFSTYPPALFDGVMRVLLFTVFPAGLCSYLPVEVVRDVTPAALLLATGAIGAYAALAILVFQRGLRRYESGSRFGVWG